MSLKQDKIVEVFKEMYSKSFEKELLSLSIQTLREELVKDKSEGSYYHTWQANIAMAFVDAFEQDSDVHLRIKMLKYEVKEIANVAAKRFLDQLIEE